MSDLKHARMMLDLAELDRKATPINTAFDAVPPRDALYLCPLRTVTQASLASQPPAVGLHRGSVPDRRMESSFLQSLSRGDSKSFLTYPLLWQFRADV